MGILSGMGPALELRKAVTLVISSNATFTLTPDGNSNHLLDEIPNKWTIHGNIALLPPTSFTSKIWAEVPQVFLTVARVLKVSTIARQSGPIHNLNYRQPSITILYGTDLIARKKENGIWYEWDITKTMFSAGNISEKQRLSALDLHDKVVVDLYAGIGYFSLTLLIHSGAKFLYACEWNPEAVGWLENNLRKNKVDKGRYCILFGDNKTTAPKGVADHVNLGLIPSSKGGWEVGVAALKRDSGGILHVHGNVDVDKNKDDENEDDPHHANEKIEMPPAWRHWSKHVEVSMGQIIKKLYPQEEWAVGIVQVVKVKSYGPRVHHLVADLKCTPCTYIPEASN